MPDALLAVPLPHMGVSVQEATVVAWHKEVGDHVRAGEPLCDISTDKVDTEIVSPAEGVLARIATAAGDTVAVGATLGELAVGDAGAAETTLGKPAVGDAAAAETTLGKPTGAGAETESAPAAVGARRFDPAAAAQAVLDRAANGNADPIVSPVARRLAREHGIELAGLAGTGLRGRIRKVDVLAAIEASRSAPVSASGTPPAGSTPPATGTPGGDHGRDGDCLPRGYEDVPHELVVTSRQRRLIAEHMIRSRQTAAHMTTEVEVDMTLAGRAREQMNGPRVAGGLAKLTHLALIAKATCAALLEFPDLNATFEGERLIRWTEVNLGIAVDTEQGLIVPVVRGCERLTAPAIADAIAGLAARARARRLTPEDTRAGTFTISNPGSVGACSAMAIINQPQVAILGMPVIVRRPAVVADEHGQETLGIRPIMNLALTFDHRAVDGAYATRCAVRVKALLESWDAAAYA